MLTSLPDPFSLAAVPAPAFNDALWQPERRTSQIDVEMIREALNTAFLKGRNYEVVKLDEAQSSQLSVGESAFQHQIGQINDAMIREALHLVFMKGRQYQVLRLEEVLLTAEKGVLQEQIEQYKIVHPVEWNSKAENIKVSIQTLAHKIRTFIQEHELFIAKEKTNAEWLLKIRKGDNRVSAYLDFYTANDPHLTYQDLWRIDGAYQAAIRYLPYLKLLLRYSEMCAAGDALLGTYPSYQGVVIEGALERAESSSKAVVLQEQIIGTVENYMPITSKINELAGKVERMRRENGALKTQKEEMRQYHLETLKSLHNIPYDLYCDWFNTFAKEMRSRIFKENELLKTAFPILHPNQKLSRDSFMAKNTVMMGQMDGLLAEVQAMGEVFKKASWTESEELHPEKGPLIRDVQFIRYWPHLALLGELTREFKDLKF